ncbi:hypothetical protein B5F40_14840 [Gordonibacter sp. An230]|uniref:hypothetical protein n=1 Tax=Gordonibacter sp. An230 TaxID=1965592 RepID=UPI000B3AA0CE|nr:hypothetical protein [Gordonibacter sp. An230]OUO86652.1 hypothetical protein B5F40_14840 [Gordonibacter sp. An230]
MSASSSLQLRRISIVAVAAVLVAAAVALLPTRQAHAAESVEEHHQWANVAGSMTYGFGQYGVGMYDYSIGSSEKGEWVDGAHFNGGVNDSWNGTRVLAEWPVNGRKFLVEVDGQTGNKEMVGVDVSSDAWVTTIKVEWVNEVRGIWNCMSGVRVAAYDGNGVLIQELFSDVANMRYLTNNTLGWRYHSILDINLNIYNETQPVPEPEPEPDPEEPDVPVEEEEEGDITRDAPEIKMTAGGAEYQSGTWTNKPVTVETFSKDWSGGFFLVLREELGGGMISEIDRTVWITPPIYRDPYVKTVITEETPVEGMGIHSVLTDSAGRNVSNKSGSMVVKIDTTKPVIKEAYVNSWGALAATVTDNLSGVYSVQAKGLGSEEYRPLHEISVEGATGVLTIRAIDNAGNETYKLVAVKDGGVVEPSEPPVDGGDPGAGDGYEAQRSA